MRMFAFVACAAWGACAAAALPQGALRPAALEYVAAGGQTPAPGAAPALWRNERAHFQFVFSPGVPPARVSAQVGALKASCGAEIPRAAVQVRFVRDGYAGFMPEGSAGAAGVVWVSVHVPKTVPAGTYTGAVTLRDGSGGSWAAPLSFDVRHECLPDPAQWTFFGDSRKNPWVRPDAWTVGARPSSLGQARWQGAYAFARKLPAAERCALVRGSSLASPEAEMLCDAVETYEKLRLLTDSQFATWHLPHAFKDIDLAAGRTATPGTYAAWCGKIEAAIDGLSTPASVNGRRVERIVKTYGASYGYETDIEEVHLVQHPLHPQTGGARGLYVVLHSAGHNAVNALLCTRNKGNHDIYRAPDDFYALYLDCKMAQSTDWWWGAHHTRGFALSPCEKRLLATIEEVVAAYGIDRERIYLCGNSMGGSGGLGFGLRHGDIFAAVKVNVPALVEHACMRMGWDAARGATAQGADLSVLPEPPLLIDYSAPNDKKWSTGHEHLIAMMRTRKYPWMAFWADFGHANNDAVMTAKNDMIHRLAWTEVRKSDVLPVFTHASSDTPSPWPDDRATAVPGQINAFFRWGKGSVSAQTLSIALSVTDAPSRHFKTPACVTADVTLRRTGAFRPQPGETLSWSYGNEKGTLRVAPDGLVTLKALRMTAAPQMLVVSRQAR